MSTFSDRELGILDRISQNSGISQRELAKTTGISLGLINVILQRFIKTGYLQVSHLNKRKLEYLLTPHGFLAVTRKTYRYATDTVRNYQHIQSHLESLLRDLCESGYNYFSIYGDGELKTLIESVFSVALTEKVVTLGEGHRDDPQAVVLNVTVEPMVGDFKGNVVNVLEKMSQGQKEGLRLEGQS